MREGISLSAHDTFFSLLYPLSFFSLFISPCTLYFVLCSVLLPVLPALIALSVLIPTLATLANMHLMRDPVSDLLWSVGHTSSCSSQIRLPNASYRVPASCSACATVSPYPPTIPISLFFIPYLFFPSSSPIVHCTLYDLSHKAGNRWLKAERANLFAITCYFIINTFTLTSVSPILPLTKYCPAGYWLLSMLTFV